MGPRGDSEIIRILLRVNSVFSFLYVVLLHIKLLTSSEREGTAVAPSLVKYLAF